MVDSVFDFLFDGCNSALSVEASLDHIICHHKLIKFLLQVVVLESKDVSMVLKGVQLLLVAVAGLKKAFVASSDGLDLTANNLEFILELHVVVVDHAHVVVQFMGLLTLPVLLSNQLALSLEQEAVALAVVLNVLLEHLYIGLSASNLCPCDIELTASVFILHRRVVERFVESPDLVVELVHLTSLGI